MRLLLGICVVFLFASATVCLAETVKYSDLEGDWFENMHVVENNLVLKFKSKGSTYHYSINRGSFKINKYGETIILQTGDTLKIVERHGSIEFSVPPEKIKSYGFHIKRISDFSSFGKGITEANGYLLIVDKQEVKSEKNLNKTQNKGYMPQKEIVITPASVDAALSVIQSRKPKESDNGSK